MPAYRRGYIRAGDGKVVGRFEEVIDEGGDKTRTEWRDVGNGQREITHISKDGTKKTGTIEPGGSSSKGVGN